MTDDVIDAMTDVELGRAAAKVMGYCAKSVPRYFDPVNDDNAARELLMKVCRDRSRAVVRACLKAVAGKGKKSG